MQELEKADESIILVTHIAFADDHLTAITFLVSINASNIYIAKKISIILNTTRGLLAEATKEIGCAINPIKSENIVPHVYADLVDLNFENDTVNDQNIYKGKEKFK